MTMQRRRGQQVQLYKLVEVTDNRGNSQLRVDRAAPVSVRASFTPTRGARAEVPGQQEIDVYTVLLDPTVDIGLWNIIAWRGAEWDVVTPASLHDGIVRGTRHITVEIRRRPPGPDQDGGGVDG